MPDRVRGGSGVPSGGASHHALAATKGASRGGRVRLDGTGGCGRARGDPRLARGGPRMHLPGGAPATGRPSSAPAAASPTDRRPRFPPFLEKSTMWTPWTSGTTTAGLLFLTVAGAASAQTPFETASPESVGLSSERLALVTEALQADVDAGN